MSQNQPLDALRTARSEVADGAGAALLDEAIGRAEQAGPKACEGNKEKNTMGNTATKPAAAKKAAAKKAAAKPAAERAASTEPVRARRRNRQTGNFIAIVDTSLMTTYKYEDPSGAKQEVKLDPEKGRWACVSEGTGGSVQTKSFAEACLVARTPADWDKGEAKALVQKGKDAEQAEKDKAAKAEAKAKEKADKAAAAEKAKAEKAEKAKADKAAEKDAAKS